MPTCILCQAIKTRLDKNNLCAECRTQQNVNDDDKVNEFLANLDQNKAVNELTIKEMLDIMRVSIAPVLRKVDNISIQLDKLDVLVQDNATKLAQLRNESDNHKDSIEKLQAESNTVKQVVLHQQEYLEKCRRNELRGILIMSGIPNDRFIIEGHSNTEEENTDDNSKIKSILSYIGYESNENDFELYRIPSNNPEMSSHKVKLKFLDTNKANDIISKAKKLKYLESTKIFIKYEEPYFTRKENDRLRKARYELSQANPNDNIKLAKGKLVHNGTIVDKFDLNNQIF